MSNDDLELLRQYTQQGSEEAFATLVNRHLNLVYSIALRVVRSPPLAEETAQSVFADLARNADNMKPDTILTAWLYRVTHHTAVDVMRRESRRQTRERKALEIAEVNGTTSEWKQIEPLLEEAMEALEEADRAAVLLRHFENKSLREVGQTLGISEDAAQKRVSRAVEHLREFFTRCGVAVGAGGVVVAVSANAVQAAPTGLAAAISSAVLAGTTIATAATATATTTATITKAIAMTTLQKTLIIATITVTIGTGIYEARQASSLRDQVQLLQQQQLPLAEQIQELTRDLNNASNRLAAFRRDNERLNNNTAELVRLRGEVDTLRTTLAEASRTNAEHSASASVPRPSDNENPTERMRTAQTIDLNPVTPVNAAFEISQLRDAGNDSIESAAQTALWSVFNRDEQGFDRIRYRDPDAPQITENDLQQRLEGLASRFAGVTNVTIAFWSKDGDNQRLVHFRAAWPDNNQSADTPEGGTLVFHRGETGWYLDQFVVQGR